MHTELSALEAPAKDHQFVNSGSLPALGQQLPLPWPTDPLLNTEQPSAMVDTELSAVEARARDHQFVNSCSLSALRQHLPLPWPTPPATAPCPKRSYRSHYDYSVTQGLWDIESARLDDLSDFDLQLLVTNYEGLRPVLAEMLGWTSARGWCPFDPLSMFLLTGWQITNGWSRAQTLRNLRSPRYADYAKAFGFEDGVYPTEGGMRHFLTTLGKNSDTNAHTVTVHSEEGPIEVVVQGLNQLLAQSISLAQKAKVLSAQASQKAVLCADGMIQEAASRMRCNCVQQSCYHRAPRPCPAKEKGKKGCDCDSQACSQICRHAPARDPQARFVCYEGSNQPKLNPNKPADAAKTEHKRGQPHYGYRSVPLELIDPVRRFSLVAMDDFLSANAPEQTPAAGLLVQVPSLYPQLHLDTVVGDAAFGYELFLGTVYNLGAKRVIDLRAHSTDLDKELWPIRGYDDKGRPICPFGYKMCSNGFDAHRHRHKWVCNKACLRGKTPVVCIEAVSYPPLECAYGKTEHPLGRIINVAQRFADGSLRLVRDIAFGCARWKQLYHRARNGSESRNSTFEHWRLKRLRVYGLPRAKAITFLADLWLNLTTITRLIREATVASRSLSKAA